jgi:hypothetical protein
MLMRLRRRSDISLFRLRGFRDRRCQRRRRNDVQRLRLLVIVLRFIRRGRIQQLHLRRRRLRRGWHRVQRLRLIRVMRVL